MAALLLLSGGNGVSLATGAPTRGGRPTGAPSTPRMTSLEDRAAIKVLTSTNADLRVEAGK